MVEARRPRDKDQLRRAIIECWDKIPMSYIRNCINGIPDRMAKAIVDADEKIVLEEEEEELSEVEYDNIDDGYESEGIDDESDNEPEVEN